MTERRYLRREALHLTLEELDALCQSHLEAYQHAEIMCERAVRPIVYMIRVWYAARAVKWPATGAEVAAMYARAAR